MHTFARAVLLGSVTILVFDTLGSLAARAFEFEYYRLTLGSILIYGLIGGYAGKRLSIGRAVAVALSVAAVDMTLGWAISWHIGPGRVDDPALPFPGLLLLAVPVMISVATIPSAIGAWLVQRRQQRFEQAA